MRFEEAVKIARERGYRLLSKDEFLRFAKRAGEYGYFYPYGCLHCGRAEGEKDFEEIVYIILPDKLSDKEEQEVTELWGIVSGGFNYTLAAKCRYCGYSEIFSEFEYI